MLDSLDVLQPCTAVTAQGVPCTNSVAGIVNREAAKAAGLQLGSRSAAQDFAPSISASESAASVEVGMCQAHLAAVLSGKAAEGLSTQAPQCSPDQIARAQMLRAIVQQTSGSTPTVQRTVLTTTAQQLLDTFHRMGKKPVSETPRAGAEFHQNLDAITAIAKRDPSIVAPERILQEYEAAMSHLLDQFDAANPALNSVQGAGMGAVAHKVADVHAAWTEYMDVAMGAEASVTPDRLRTISGRIIASLTALTVARAFSNGALAHDPARASASADVSTRPAYENRRVSALGVLVKASLGAMAQWMADDRGYRLVRLSGALRTDSRTADRAAKAVATLRGHSANFAQAAVDVASGAQVAAALLAMRTDPLGSDLGALHTAAPAVPVSVVAPPDAQPAPTTHSSPLDHLDMLRASVETARALDQQSVHHHAASALNEQMSTDHGAMAEALPAVNAGLSVVPLMDRFDQASGRLAGALLENGPAAAAALGSACLDAETRRVLSDADLAPAAQLATLLHARLGLDWTRHAFP
jgi:hypothetical protein